MTDAVKPRRVDEEILASIGEVSSGKDTSVSPSRPSSVGGLPMVENLKSARALVFWLGIDRGL